MQEVLPLGKDFKVTLALTGGKVLVTIEYDGLDAALLALKPSLPVILQPLVDLIKTEVDAQV